AQVPRADEAVRRRAGELIAGVAGRRERLAALVDFARRQVRYVAVEVGIGGYRPYPPAAVLGRGWGDCKDKAVLLIELLREAGIEAFPALLRAGESGRLDRDFPAPDQFNHLIVAVPADGLGLAPDDPVAGGYLFVDPTQTRGGLRWLSPWLQDQDALVVREGGGELVRTAIREELEVHQAEVEVAVDSAGNARGEARVVFSGAVGANLADLLAAGPPEPVESLGRQLLSWFFPGVVVSSLHWAQETGELPRFSFTATVVLPALLQGASGVPPAAGPIALHLPGEAMTPPPSLLAERALPVVGTPGRRSISWRLRLPAGWCPVKPQKDVFENALGGYRQTVASTGGEVTIERSTVLAGRWIEPAAFPALKELALAEHRGMKRRVRLECAEAR
ncbi:MAG: transglutaminase domain-containing protein, partial [Thermoanaerobaculia bacterium]